MNPEDRNRWLTFIVIFAVAWMAMNYWMSKRAANAPPQSSSTPAQKPAEVPLAQPVLPDVPLETRTVSTEDLVVELTSIGAAVERVELLKYHLNAGEKAPLAVLDRIAEDRLGPRRSLVIREFNVHGKGLLDFEHWPFRLEGDRTDAGGVRTIAFRAEQDGFTVRKTYVFAKRGYDIRLTVTVANGTAEPQDVDYWLVGAAGIRHDEPPALAQPFTAKLAGRNSPAVAMEFRNVSAPDAPEAKPDNLVLSKSCTEWAALRGRYFAAILVADDPAQAIAAAAEPLDPAEQDKAKRNLAVALRCTTITRLGPNESASRGYFLRVGPQKVDQLDAEAYAYAAPQGDGKVSRDLVASVDFSYAWVARPARWLLSLLLWLQGLVGNYGLAIFLMTLLVKLALHPLQRKGSMAMQQNQAKMQVLAPKLKVIQEQYKDDHAKLQAAQMRLYKEEGVNPAGMLLGCLPMALQMPVWIALYGAIRGAFELRQESFLWVTDLTRPDTVMLFNFWPLNWWPGGLNILPILYAGMMMLQSFMTPLPPDPQQRNQAQMMRFMPLMFFFLFYKMPSAFMLYFAASAILGYAESWLIKKQLARLKAREAAAAPAASGGGGPGAAKPAPITDAQVFWANEARKKLGKDKK